MNNRRESRSCERKRKRTGKFIDSYYKNKFILNIVATAAKFSKSLGAPGNQEVFTARFSPRKRVFSYPCHTQKDEKYSDENGCEG